MASEGRRDKSVWEGVGGRCRLQMLRAEGCCEEGKASYFLLSRPSIYYSSFFLVIKRAKETIQTLVYLKNPSTMDFIATQAYTSPLEFLRNLSISNPSALESATTTFRAGGKLRIQFTNE